MAECAVQAEDAAVAIGRWINNPTTRNLVESLQLAGTLSRSVWDRALVRVTRKHGAFKVLRWINEAADSMGDARGAA